MPRLDDLTPRDSIVCVGNKTMINKLHPTRAWVLVALAKAHAAGLAFLDREGLRQRLVAVQAAEGLAAGNLLALNTVVYDQATDSIGLPDRRYLLVQKRGTGEKTASYSLTQLGHDVLDEFMSLNPQWVQFVWPERAT